MAVVLTDLQSRSLSESRSRNDITVIPFTFYYFYNNYIKKRKYRFYIILYEMAME